MCLLGSSEEYRKTWLWKGQISFLYVLAMMFIVFCAEVSHDYINYLTKSFHFPLQNLSSMQLASIVVPRN